MRRHRVPAVLLAAALLAVGCEPGTPTGVPAPADALLHQVAPSAGAVVTEPSWYQGRRYLISVPSAGSRNPNQFEVACFHLGVNLNDQKATGPTGTMYAILNPVDPDHRSECFPHDHVLSAVPGVRGYSPRWRVVLGLPGEHFDPGILPLTSVAEVLAAEAAGQITLHSPVDLLGAEGDILLAPVIGRAAH